MPDTFRIGVNDAGPYLVIEYGVGGSQTESLHRDGSKHTFLRAFDGRTSSTVTTGVGGAQSMVNVVNQQVGRGTFTEAEVTPWMRAIKTIRDDVGLPAYAQETEVAPQQTGEPEVEAEGDFITGTNVTEELEQFVGGRTPFQIAEEQARQEALLADVADTNQEVAGVIELGNALKWGLIVMLSLILVVIVVMSM